MDAVVLEVTEYLSDAELLFSLEDADDASGAAPASSAGDDVDVASSRQFPALPADAKPPLPPALLLGVARTSSAGSDASAASTTGAASPSACLASDGKVLERMKEAGAPAPPPRSPSGALASCAQRQHALTRCVAGRPRPPRRAPLAATPAPAVPRAAPPAAPPHRRTAPQTHPPAHPLPATTSPWTTCWRGGTRRRRSTGGLPPSFLARNGGGGDGDGEGDGDGDGAAGGGAAAAAVCGGAADPRARVPDGCRPRARFASRAACRLHRARRPARPTPARPHLRPLSSSSLRSLAPVPPPSMPARLTLPVRRRCSRSRTSASRASRPRSSAG